MAEITRLHPVRQRHLRALPLPHSASVPPSLATAATTPAAAPFAALNQGVGSAPYLVPVLELLTPGFVLRYTRHADLQALLWSGGLPAQALLGLSESPNANWDAFIARNSQFSNWAALVSQARGEWLGRRLGLVVDRD